MSSATLTKVTEDYVWIVGSPRDIERDLDEAEIATVASLLVAHLPTAIDPKSFDRIMGPEDIVTALVDKWVAEMTSRGLQLEAPVAMSLQLKVSYVTLATIPPPPPALSAYELELATPEDLEILAHFFVDFRTIPQAISLEDARETMRANIELGEVWICRVEGDIVGFCATGRKTPNTMAIRNVYVSPKHRRKGVAEAMVSMLTRYLLGAEPLGFSGGLAAGGSPKDVKKEISLNVGQEHAERLYRKCGFLVGEDDRDPASGRKGWFMSSYRVINVLDV